MSLQPCSFLLDNGTTLLVSHGQHYIITKAHRAAMEKTKSGNHNQIRVHNKVCVYFIQLMNQIYIHSIDTQQHIRLTLTFPISGTLQRAMSEFVHRNQKKHYTSRVGEMLRKTIIAFFGSGWSCIGRSRKWF